MNVVSGVLSTLNYKMASESRRKIITKGRLHAQVEYARRHSPFLADLYKDLPENYTLQDTRF